MLRLLFISLLLLPGILKAQVEPQQNNPYSAYGLGEINQFGSIRTMGMGGTGLAAPSPDYINFQNPALLSRSRILTHVVEHNETAATIARAYGITEEEVRLINNISDEVKEGQQLQIPVRKYTFYEAAARYSFRNTNTPNKRIISNTVDFQYFTFAVPIQQRVTLAGGLIPYSKSGLKASKDETLTGGVTSTTQDRRDGGLSQAFISGGYDVHKNFSLGMQAGMLFGKITTEHFVLTSALPDTSIGVVNENSYKSFVFKPGVFYRSKLNRSKREDSTVYLNIGFTYEFIEDTKLKSINSYQLRNIYNGVTYDSTISNIKASATLPQTIAGGIAFHKPGKWTISADLAYAKWSSAKNIDSFTVFKDSYRASLGAEWKMKGKKDKAEAKRNIYRSGLAWQTLPYTINGKRINEYAVSIGASFPMGRVNTTDKNQPLTKINVAVTGGLIGDNNNSIGQQLYVKGTCGIIINDKWFKRRRIQ